MSELIISENYNKAFMLHKQIKATVNSVKTSFYELGIKLKEMRDCKLYKELGYQNFEEYCEAEADIGRRQAYRLIQISDNLPEDFVTSMSQIGSTKLTLIAMLEPEDRTEIVQNTDLESTSVSELKEKIAELKKAHEKLLGELNEAEKKANESRKKESEAWGKVSVLRTDSEMQQAKINQLESKVKEKEDTIISLEGTIEELEARPIEVIASSESHEVENMRKAMEKLNEDIGKQMSDLQDENIREVRRLNDKHNAEIQKLTDEHSKAIQTMAESHNAEMEKLSEEFEARLEEAKAQAAPGETVTVVNTKEIFNAYLSGVIDNIKRLFSFMETAVQDDNAQAYISQLFMLADMINDKTKKLKED